MFVLSLVTPEKRIATDVEIEEVIVPGYKGQLNILPGHAPLMTTLSTGMIKFRRSRESVFETVVVSWGYCEVHPQGVVILAETAESVDEISKERAELALHRAQEKLMDPLLETDQIEIMRRKVERAHVRLSALADDPSKTH
jgi:F-type H+-transporting ATPase subunit epsilon